MNTEQIKRMKALTVEVAEVVILDADPRNWTAYGQTPKAMQKDDRYAAKWCRGVAMSSLSVLMRLMNVIEFHERKTAGKPPQPGDEDGDYGMPTHEAEAAAEQLLERVQKRIHGSAG